MTSDKQQYLAVAEPAADLERQGRFIEAATQWEKAKSKAQLLGMLADTDWALSRALRCAKLANRPATKKQEAA